MPIVAWPGFGIKSIRWTLDRPAQVNRSAYTGARVTTANPWHGLWTAQVELAPIVSEEAALPLFAFMASLDGQVGSFRLPATEGLQKGLPAATVSATVAKGATSMTLVGAQLLPGYKVTVNDQLLQVVTADDYGITFKPPLRAQATAGTAVETGNPTCLVALAASSVSWSVEPGKVYSASSFDVEEVF